MRRLHLDFRRGRRPTPWVGRVLLAAALVVCADMGASYHALRQVLQANELRLAKRAPGRPAARVSTAEVAAVRETVQRLALPWDQLFLALEAAASESVALAAIEPDTAKGTVTISGDGKENVDSALLSDMRAAAGERAIEINGLAILTRDTPEIDRYYSQQVVNGFVVPVDDPRDFERALRRKLLYEVAGANPEAQPGALALAAGPR